MTLGFQKGNVILEEPSHHALVTGDSASSFIIELSRVTLHTTPG